MLTEDLASIGDIRQLTNVDDLPDLADPSRRELEAAVASVFWPWN